jgi:predicted DNA-binding antitoxin AbrB/MazE fold protein
MPQTITAVYENGVFIPRMPVHLPQHTTVTISLPVANAKTVKQRFSILLQEPLVAEQLVIPSRDERHER